MPPPRFVTVRQKAPRSYANGAVTFSSADEVTQPYRTLRVEPLGWRLLGWFCNMKIAQVAPLTKSVPPRLLGGTERIVSYLTDELVAMGHEVTLFATGDSHTSAELAAAWPRALRFDTGLRDTGIPHILMLKRRSIVAPANSGCHPLPPGLLPFFCAQAAINAISHDPTRTLGFT